jgi:hypothetical protein
MRLKLPHMELILTRGNYIGGVQSDNRFRKAMLEMNPKLWQVRQDHNWMEIKVDRNTTVN